MVLFAEVGDVVWQALIAAVLAMYMEWSRQRTAKRVQEVKTDLEANTAVTNEAATEAKAAVVTATNVAEKATETMEEMKTVVNGRMDELLNEARKKAYAEGFAVGQQQAIKQMKEKHS